MQKRMGDGDGDGDGADSEEEAVGDGCPQPCGDAWGRQDERFLHEMEQQIYIWHPDGQQVYHAWDETGGHVGIVLHNAVHDRVQQHIEQRRCFTKMLFVRADMDGHHGLPDADAIIAALVRRERKFPICIACGCGPGTSPDRGIDATVCTGMQLAREIVRCSNELSNGRRTLGIDLDVAEAALRIPLGM